MKLNRIISVVLAGIILAFALVSCGGEPMQEVTVTLKIVGTDESEPVLDTQVTVKSANPTVLDAFITACDENEIPYVLSDGNDSVKDIQEFTNHTDENGIAYYWMYYINDVEPTSGKANANTISDGDVILYSYISFDPSESK